MVKEVKEYMFKWLRMGRSICKKVEDRKDVYIPWLRNIKRDMFNGEG